MKYNLTNFERDKNWALKKIGHNFYLNKKTKWKIKKKSHYSVQD